MPGRALGAPAGRPLGIPADVPGPESRERVAESIELVKAAWTREEVTFEGKYWSTKDLPVLPKPLQKPHPPVLLAANSDDTFAYAGRLGVGVIGTMFSQPLPRMTDRLAEFESAKPSVRPAQPQSAHVMVSFFVARTQKEAHRLTRENWREGDREAGRELMRRRGIDPSHPEFATGAVGWMTWDFAKAIEVCVYDEPSACVERLQALKEGLPTLDTCILEFNRRGRISSEKVRDSMRLFAEKVMPELSN